MQTRFKMVGFRKRFGAMIGSSRLPSPLMGIVRKMILVGVVLLGGLSLDAAVVINSNTDHSERLSGSENGCSRDTYEIVVPEGKRAVVSVKRTSFKCTNCAAGMRAGLGTGSQTLPNNGSTARANCYKTTTIYVEVFIGSVDEKEKFVGWNGNTPMFIWVPCEHYSCEGYYDLTVTYEDLVPDLAVTSVSLSTSGFVMADEPQTLQYKIENVGYKTASATSVSVCDDGLPVMTFSFAELGSGYSRTGQIELGRLAPGRHVFSVKVAKVDGEIVETNNEKTFEVMVYARKPYVVRFDANGGFGAMPDQKFVFGEEQTLSANAYVCGDALFMGWSLTQEGSVAFKDNQTVNNLDLDGDGIETLYAVWLMPNVEDVLYTVENGEVTITGVHSDFSGDLLIPSVLEGCPVTSIGEKAFRLNHNLTSVIIPSTVTEIGVSAFAGCVNLKSIILPAGLKALRTYVLESCERLSSIEIPEGVVEIEWGAMFRCNSLKTLTIPSSVRNIGHDAFRSNPSDDSALSDVTILPGVTNIGSEAFGYRTNLRTIVLPEGVISMRNDAFLGCKSLVSITLPSTLKALTHGSFKHAFLGCINLKTMVFNGDAPSIENDFDSDCSDCTAYVKKGSTGWGVTIPGKWHGINIAYQPDRYAVAYELRGGVHGADHPTDVVCGEEFPVSAPTRAGRTFVGWTVTSGLDASTAKWGLSSGAWMPIENSATLCVNGATGSVLFKNLTEEVNGHITLTANWTSDTEYDILLLPGDGKGREQVVGIARGCVGKLPANTFASPVGKSFAGWAGSNGRRYDDGMLVFNLAEPGETVTMTATWE